VKVGLISDTHGLLRPEALAALQGVQHIIHAGDIGAGVLEALERIAPVTAIRGNNDTGPWANDIPDRAEVQLEDARIYVVHDLAEFDSFADCDVVISGHSHIPEFYTEEGILYVNPGSAGPKRFKLPISVGFLEISGATVTPSLQELQIQPVVKR
jgi:putative phosphoesterase